MRVNSRIEFKLEPLELSTTTATTKTTRDELGKEDGRAVIGSAGKDFSWLVGWLANLALNFQSVGFLTLARSLQLLLAVPVVCIDTCKR